MRKFCFLIFLSLITLTTSAMDAAMYQWKSHFAYGSTRSLAEGKNEIFGLAGGALFSVNKSTEEITTYSKQNGLNGGEIAQIAFDPLSNTLIIAYEDGLIDFLTGSRFIAMTDLQQKSMTASKYTNHITIEKGLAYFCMPFGIMVVDVQHRQITDTYYIGEDGSEVNVVGVTFSSDSIFAISSNTIFSIGKNENKMDYQNWRHTGSLPADSTYRAIAVWREDLFVVANSTVAKRDSGIWTVSQPEFKCNGLRLCNNHLFLLTPINGIYQLNDEYAIDTIASPYVALDIVNQASTYWIATDLNGIIRQTPDEIQEFSVNGPLVNIPYRLKVAYNKLYMLAGQRWATEEPKRSAYIMMYDIQQDLWSNIWDWQVDEACGMHIFDCMNVAVDPFDHNHFYVTTYGTGMIECYGLDVKRQLTDHNSPLKSAATGAYSMYYVRTDGALYDEEGNFWVLNAETDSLVHVATHQQMANPRRDSIFDWYKMQPVTRTGENVMVYTPGEMFVDNRNPNWKWIPSLRKRTGLVLLDDNGTPQYRADDDVLFRKSFVDQDGNSIVPEFIYSIAQDNEGAIWMGLGNGLIIIPSTIDYKTSDYCEKVKIPRNDGTGLADYLLETERLNAIVVDGANRKWIGTEASGLYLVSADGLETLAHYTEDNSPLLSNTIQSLAIDPQTGRVFIGTAKGLMSYQNDAAPGSEDYSTVYAYPNPVRPDYSGVITIRGLMDETIVHIVDNAGNLVCETRSNGGLAIWDGKTADGRRAASGVYTVFLNENNDNQHAVTKILLMH